MKRIKVFPLGKLLRRIVPWKFYKGFIERKKNDKDERNLVISVTEKGLALRDEALSVPGNIGSCIQLPLEEAQLLYKVLYKILDNLNKN